MKKIVINNLNKCYDDHEILHNINLEIEEQEFICILGKSGCGKSTFLKVLAGIESFNKGSIVLADKEYKNIIDKSELRNFGFVFQEANLLPWLTVEKNLKIMLDIFNLKTEEYFNRIDYILDMVGLLKYKTVFPHELSGGMKQRVGIARALVHNPSVLFLDQPFGALDAITRKILVADLLNIWKDSKKTIIMVTNNVDEALFLSKRIVIFTNTPVSINKVFNVDIDVEERKYGIIEKNKVYQNLKEEINHIIRNYGEYNEKIV